jgi:hypothetical protein
MVLLRDMFNRVGVCGLETVLLFVVANKSFRCFLSCASHACGR